jgi:hypothetical protein
MSEAFQSSIMITAALLTIIVASLVWVGRDAKRRGRSSMRIVVLCLITWPLGFLIWRGLRPPPPIRREGCYH